MSSDGIELVVTDLDGTLWDRDLQIPGSTFDALAELDRAGIAVLVATGRRRRSALLGQQHNGLCLPSVLLNGSLGVDLRSNEQFHETSFSPSEAATVLDVYHDHDLGPCVYTSLPEPDVLVGDVVSTHPRHAETLASTWKKTDLRAAVDEVGFLGFSTLGHRTRDELEPLLGSLAEHTTATVVVAFDPGFDGWSLMAQPAAVSKWNGIEAFCAREGYDPTRVLAIGDAENDIEMLRRANIGIAMGGAPTAVREAADRTTTTLEESGWAAAVLDAPR